MRVKILLFFYFLLVTFLYSHSNISDIEYDNYYRFLKNYIFNTINFIFSGENSNDIFKKDFFRDIENDTTFKTVNINQKIENINFSLYNIRLQPINFKKLFIKKYTIFIFISRYDYKGLKDYLKYFNNFLKLKVVSDNANIYYILSTYKIHKHKIFDKQKKLYKYYDRLDTVFFDLDNIFLVELGRDIKHSSVVVLNNNYRVKLDNKIEFSIEFFRKVLNNILRLFI